MTDQLLNKLHELKKQVASGEYSVDPLAVADAIVRRRWSVAVASHPALVFSITSPEWTRASGRRFARGEDVETQAVAA